MSWFHRHEWLLVSAVDIHEVRAGYKQPVGRTTSIVQQCGQCGKYKQSVLDGNHAVQIVERHNKLAARQRSSR